MVEHVHAADHLLPSDGDTDADADVVYLDNAGQARLSAAVQRVGVARVQATPWDLYAADVSVPARVRQLFASLVDANEADIAIMPSTAFAVTLAATNLEATILRGKRGRILVLQDQMCSAVYPWQCIVERSGGDLKLEVVPYPGPNESWTQLVLQRLDDDVRVACLPPLHWSDGALVDLVTIGHTCRQRQIALIVDATQAVGAWPCSVKLIQPLLLACSVHKWLRGPSGASLVYLAPQVRDSWIPLDQHGRSRVDAYGRTWEASKNEMGPSGYPERFVGDARKFDSGGKPNGLLLPMIRTALEEVVLHSADDTQKKLRVLMEPLLIWAKEAGFVLPVGGIAFHLVGIRPPPDSTTTPEDMIHICHEIFVQDRVFIAVRCGAFRISPYLDTTKHDIDCLIGAMNRRISISRRNGAHVVRSLYDTGNQTKG